jgi:amino acid permease
MTNAKLAGFITLLLVLCAGFNFLGARWYGESEFWFAMIKICLIVGASSPSPLFFCNTTERYHLLLCRSDHRRAHRRPWR